MFIAGAALAFSAVLLGIVTTLVLTVTENVDLVSDLGVDQWLEMARTFGFLSIGFLFVAYRALPLGRPKQSSAEALPSGSPEP